MICWENYNFKCRHNVQIITDGCWSGIIGNMEASVWMMLIADIALTKAFVDLSSGAVVVPESAWAASGRVERRIVRPVVARTVIARTVRRNELLCLELTII